MRLRPECIHVRHRTPQARNSVEGNGRPACCGNASCIPICPIGAKYDATVHLAQAEKHGAVVHAQTTATRIEVGAEGRVTAVRFKRWDGSEGVARGKVFVLAAHAIETPRLLLHSRN
jgi:glucose dehydrogenase